MPGASDAWPLEACWAATEIALASLGLLLMANVEPAQPEHDHRSVDGLDAVTVPRLAWSMPLKVSPEAPVLLVAVVSVDEVALPAVTVRVAVSVDVTVRAGAVTVRADAVTVRAGAVTVRA